MDPTGRKSVHVEVKDRSHVWCRYTTQTQVHYTRNSWRKLVTHLQEIVSGDLNAHVGNDAQVWKGVIGKHGDDNLNYNGSLLYCAPWALFSNTEKYTSTPWYRNSLGQRSLIDFCIVSADLFHVVLKVRVRKLQEYRQINSWLSGSYAW